MSCQERYLRPFWSSPPYKDMCGQNKCQQRYHSKVPQLQRQSFHSQREMYLPPRGIPEDEKTPVTIQEHQYSSQICVANLASDCTNPDTHAPKTSGSAIPECTTIFPRWNTSQKSCILQGPGTVVYLVQQTNSQIIISTNQPVSYIRTYNTTEEAICPRGLETSRKETTQPTTTTLTSTTTQCYVANIRVSATFQTTNISRPTTNLQSPEQTHKIVKCP